MVNKEIRLAAGGSGVRLYEVARALGISEFYFSRKLRYEMNPEEKAKILDIIKDLGSDANDS